MTLTPEQFNILATKDDLWDLESRMASKAELHGVENNIINTLDAIVKMIKDFQTELASNQSVHDRFENRITE